MRSRRITAFNSNRTRPFGFWRGDNGELVPQAAEQEAIAALRAQGRSATVLLIGLTCPIRSLMRPVRCNFTPCPGSKPYNS